jgi:hypothetical protein
VALALNRTGVVFKKCDLANHKPDSNKACAADACQHTCSDVERCPHAWTLRYWADGKQRERSFKDEVRNGRTIYGSGRISGRLLRRSSCGFRSVTGRAVRT